MNYQKTIIIMSAALILSGCFESRKNTEKLCIDNPSLRCESLNMDDGRCRVPRTDLVWHRFALLQQQTDAMFVKEYQLVAEYKKCLELAAQIKPLEQSKRKEQRFISLVHANDELVRITALLQQSSSPDVLYFLWTQLSDNQAKRRFLQLEGSPTLDTAQLQYALATFYTTRQPLKTIELLNRSLELTKPNEINVDVITSLASINYRIDAREKAYIWATVAKRFDAPTADDTNFKLLYGFPEEKYQQLDHIAQQVYSAITSGNYNRNLLVQLN